MAQKIARGQITIVDQNDAVAIQAFISSSLALTQIYNKDNDSFTPNWTSGAGLVLIPSLFAGGSVDKITSVGNAANLTPGVKTGSIKWYKNNTIIVSGQDGCTIGASNAKYALTIKTNHMTPTAPQAQYKIEGIYIDANGLEIPFWATIQFTQHQSAGATIAAIAYAPDGVIFRNDEVKTLRAHCDLWRSATIDTSNVSYAWGIKDNSVFAPTTIKTAANTGATSIVLNSVANMEPGTQIQIGSAKYTIKTVTANTTTVTLTSALTANVTVGAQVTSPFYDSMLGAGWSHLTSTNQRGVIAGWTTNEITISADAVLNFETFKCAIKDTDTSSGNASANKVVCDIISFSDISDPIQVFLESIQGFTIKNNANDVDVKAILYRNGAEIDAEGKEYTYSWKLYNNAGSTVLKTYTGKNIVVAKTDVTGKGTLICEVTKA